MLEVSVFEATAIAVRVLIWATLPLVCLGIPTPSAAAPARARPIVRKLAEQLSAAKNEDCKKLGVALRALVKQPRSKLVRRLVDKLPRHYLFCKPLVRVFSRLGKSGIALLVSRLKRIKVSASLTDNSLGAAGYAYVEALKQTLPASLPQLVGLLGHRDAHLRLAAFSVLDAGKLATLRGLAAALRSRSKGIRRRYLALVVTWFHCPSKRLPAAAAKQCKAVRARALADLLADKDARIRAEVTRSFNDLAKLRRALQDLDLGVRWAATQRLAAYAGSKRPRAKKAAALLRLALRDADYFVRREAVQALAGLAKGTKSKPVAARPAIPFGLQVKAKVLRYRVANRARRLAFRQPIQRVIPNRRRPYAVVMTGSATKRQKGTCVAAVWLVDLRAGKRRRLPPSRAFRFTKPRCHLLKDQLASWSPDGTFLLTKAKAGWDLIARRTRHLAAWVSGGRARSTRLRGNRSTQPTDCSDQDLLLRGWIAPTIVAIDAFNHQCGGSSMLANYDLALGHTRDDIRVFSPKRPCAKTGVICVADIN
jgi:hypothetical protein